MQGFEEGITGMARRTRTCGDVPAAHSRRFGAAERGSAFVALGDVDLEDILCLKEERTVTRGNCVGYRGRQVDRCSPETPRDGTSRRH